MFPVFDKKCVHCTKNYKGNLSSKYCSLKCRILFNSILKDSGCRVWNLTLNKGYGRMCIRKKNPLVHRVMYEEIHGKVDKGINICHSCDNTKCVNPEHLYTASQSQNMIDCVTRGRHQNTKGEKNGFSKLIWNLVEEIRLKRKNGMKLKDLSETYKVNIMTIQKVVTYQSWVSK